MKIMKKAQAGAMQSSDLMVFVEPAEEVTVENESTVKRQFEYLIRARVDETLAARGAIAKVSARPSAEASPARSSALRRCVSPPVQMA